MTKLSCTLKCGFELSLRGRCQSIVHCPTAKTWNLLGTKECGSKTYGGTPAMGMPCVGWKKDGTVLLLVVSTVPRNRATHQ